MATEIIIHTGNMAQFRGPEHKNMRGLLPRDWVKVPCGSMPGAPMASIAKIPRTDWSGIIRDINESKGLLSQIVRKKGIKNRNQNGRGYCWAHSTVSTAMVARAKANLPIAELSAYAIACIIKNFRDQGGWNGESMKFLRERGCPTEEFWPQQGVSRQYDNPATWADAAKYKCTEWEDIPDRDFDQLMTYLLLGMAAPIDLNWWAHSVCAIDPVDGMSMFHSEDSDDFAPSNAMRSDSGKLLTLAEFEDVWEISDSTPVPMEGAYGVRIWNSWGEDWSDGGYGILTESRATPDGSIVLRQMAA